jgi:murein DD-endopeptidase MepM/ murein hydrolase activator NlpD
MPANRSPSARSTLRDVGVWVASATVPRPRSPRRGAARFVAISAVVLGLPCVGAAAGPGASPSAGRVQHPASTALVLGRLGAPYTAVRTSSERASRGSARLPMTTSLPPAGTVVRSVGLAVAAQPADPKIVDAARVRTKAAAGNARTAAKRLPAWVRPNAGPLSSPFGRRWGRMHSGIDLAGGYGSPILAAASGVVTYAGPEEGFGRIIKITEPDGTQTWYGHMSRYLVAAGDHVDAGEKIALVGAAGDATGPHLHFEVHVGGRAIDPLPFLRAHGVRI